MDGHYSTKILRDSLKKSLSETLERAITTHKSNNAGGVEAAYEAASIEAFELAEMETGQDAKLLYALAGMLAYGQCMGTTKRLDEVIHFWGGGWGQLGRDAYAKYADNRTYEEELPTMSGRWRIRRVT